MIKETKKKSKVRSERKVGVALTPRVKFQAFIISLSLNAAETHLHVKTFADTAYECEDIIILAFTET